MAYTYDDFITKANSTGMMSKFSQSDLNVAAQNPEYGISLLSLLQDSQNAKTPEAQLLANEAASQLRKSYHVQTAGTTDSGIQSSSVTQPAESTGSFTYDGDTEYKKLLKNIVNGEPSSYNPETDPTYSAYKKQYLREGDRAAADILAKVSANSGGVPSSYAISAAQQAKNYYAGQLTDIIPTLEQNAYTRYINGQMNGLSALQNDRDFAYQVYLNQQALQKQEEQEKYDRALAAYQLLGYATPEIAEILGLNTGNQSAGGSSGEYGGSYSGSGYNNGSLTSEQIKILQNHFGTGADGMWGPASQAAAGGLTADEAWAKYEQQNTGGEIPNGVSPQTNHFLGRTEPLDPLKDKVTVYDLPFAGSTYQEAVDYLKANGISAIPMTQIEWQKHKNKNNSAGGEHEASSYQEYLAAYVYGKMGY